MYCSPCATVGKVQHAFILCGMHNVCPTRSPPCLSVCKTTFHHFTRGDDCSNQKELIYTYDGLYEVTAADMVTGQEGFKICKSVYQPSQASLCLQCYRFGAVAIAFYGQLFILHAFVPVPQQHAEQTQQAKL